MSGLVQLSFSIDEARFKALGARAAKMNVSVKDYARRLFDAAVAARVAHERDAMSGDAELDRQVKAAFLLADCEPEYIAEAIGAPVERVKRILAGWRGELGKPAAPDAPVAALPPPMASGQEAPARPAAPSGPIEPTNEPRVGGYPREAMRRWWAEGRTTREIANALGKKEGAISVWVSNHRDICPARR